MILFIKSVHSPLLSTLFPYTTLFRSRGIVSIYYNESWWSMPLPEAQNSQIASSLDVARLQSGVLERSEEHTSELQSRGHLVCRLLLEKKNIEEFYTSL